ncbi:hypothetical protein QTP86_029029 [Hemibagrus guttatus]|nr:hypothetical protein QTP86_029029 [Hemibagrus guttatus]
MSSTSQKHKEFVAEPMGEKPVMTLAGIGEVLGKRLEEKGFDKAYVVLGQFLVLKKDEELFREWLKDTCGANSKQQGDCYSCLRECGQYLSKVSFKYLLLPSWCQIPQHTFRDLVESMPRWVRAVLAAKTGPT